MLKGALDVFSAFQAAVATAKGHYKIVRWYPNRSRQSGRALELASSGP
jgi:hypothetical protein